MHHTSLEAHATRKARTWRARVAALGRGVQPDAPLPPAVQVSAHGVENFGWALGRRVSSRGAHVAGLRGRGIEESKVSAQQS